ncbi:Conserved protein of unknown function. Containing Na+/Pi-cotransporter domain [Magnetospira sp. QH-2]|nr:Conserved protein of unknown function. Containing Na+/Pi-cotransporter domain [Magnetospira sp. QH-2]
MQSSSLVSVITISFLSAGLIGLTSGIGIIFGANIGTTTGAWLVAGFGLKVKISAYAMPMLVFGIILVFQRSRSLKGIGYILAGLGFLFLGIHHMKEGFEAFRHTIDLSSFAIEGYAGLLIYTGIGIAATVIMQSSHATLVLILTALSAQQISYENALALAIGANIGTTITAIIGAMSANYQGKRLAGAHLMFNLVTGMVAIIFIHQLVIAVEFVANNVGIREDDYSLKLAVFHTIFNLLGVIIMVPLIGKMVAFLEKSITAPEQTVVQPRYLNESVEDFPETMLEAVRNEAMHLYDNAFEIMAHGLNLHRHDILSDVDLEKKLSSSREVIDIEIDDVYLTKVKALYSAIIDFISRTQTRLPNEYGNELFELRHVCGTIVQSVKEVKHLRKNMSAYANSDNEFIRREYNGIRIQIAELLRMIQQLRDGQNEDVDSLDLDEFKVAIAEENIVVNGTLDGLIRDGRITSGMGSSLINDMSYAKTIIWNLADLADSLFGKDSLDQREAKLLVSLDQEEVDELASESGSVN